MDTRSPGKDQLAEPGGRGGVGEGLYIYIYILDAPMGAKAPIFTEPLHDRIGGRIFFFDFSLLPKTLVPA